MTLLSGRSSREPLRPMLLFLVLPVILFPACSSPIEERRPVIGPLLEDGDDVVIHRPVSSSPENGVHLKRYLLSDPDKASDEPVRSFPEAAPRLQTLLGRILDRSISGSAIPFDIRSQIPIPYSYSKKESPLVLNIRLSDRAVFHETPEAFFGPDAESDTDAVLTGRVRDVLFGFSPAIKKQLNQSIPPGTALIRIRTTWSVGIRSGDRVRVERFRVDERVRINLNRFSVKPRERYFSCRRAVDLLLRRISWNVASRFIPHRYDTSETETDSS